MDHQEIKSLIQLLRETQLTEIEIEEKGKRIRVRQESFLPPAGVAPLAGVAPPSPSGAPVPSLPASLPQDTPAALEGISVITSPIVGTFYKTHTPGAEPYVRVGDRVKKGQILCIVEAMKLMNEIESDLDGTLVAICVEDKSPVEYGQPLFHITPA